MPFRILGMRLALFLAIAIGSLTPVAVGKWAATASAFAVCDEAPADTAELISITSPAPSPLGFGGPAPLTLTIQITEGLAVFETGSLTSSFNWGDGSSSGVTVLRCPDEVSSYWPTQTLSHTYVTPGPGYQTTWNFNIEGMSFPLPFVTIVVVEAAQSTPVPTPTQTAAPGQTTTPGTTPSGQTTPSPTLAGGSSETPGAGNPSASATPSVTPSPSASPSATPTTAAVAAVSATPSGTPKADEPSPTTIVNGEFRSRTFIQLEEIGEVSRDPDVVMTNMVIAGVTVWVLFSSVLLNQVLQANRSEIDRRTSRLTAPIRRLARAGHPGGSRSMPGWARTLLLPALVLGIAGLIYSVLEPDFGFNEHTGVLFGSAVLGVGLVTYLCSGLEAVAARRWTAGRKRPCGRSRPASRSRRHPWPFHAPWTCSRA